MKNQLNIATLTVSELDDLDLASLTASELAAYGDRVGWTTEELTTALELRGQYNGLGRMSERLNTTLTDPVVVRATEIADANKRSSVIQRKLPTTDWPDDGLIEARPPPVSRDGFLVRLTNSLFHKG
jgi:hypothetical protein